MVADLPSREPPSVALVVPVHRGGEAFRLCLRGVAALVPAPAEIVVVVDGEDDGSGAVAEALVSARVLHLPVRRGPAAARNAGARLASGDVLLFLDADVVPSPEAVGQVQRAFGADPRLGALIGSYDADPAAPSFLSQYRNLLHHYTHQTGERRTFAFWGACGAIRREVFGALGGFDEAYAIPSMEDLELGYRLSRAGYRIELHKEIQVKHLKAWGLRNMLSTDLFQRALPWSRLLLREGRIHNDLNLRLGARVSAILAWLVPLGIAASLSWPTAGYTAAASAFLLLAVNAGFYRFLARVRGAPFAIAAVPWHWLYFIYGSAAFAWVVLLDRPDSPAARSPRGAAPPDPAHAAAPLPSPAAGAAAAASRGGAGRPVAHSPGAGMPH
jgi:glycosyltransferase involved in cell wall biosynthesis